MVGSSAYAGQFMGIEPGISTEQETTKVLGKSEKHIKDPIDKEEWYEFNAKKYDLRRLVVAFSKEMHIVKHIDVYPLEDYDKEKYTFWFQAEVPFESSHDQNGKLIEIYLPQYVALHYAGSTDRSPVQYFSHLDPQLFSSVSDSVNTPRKQRGFLGVGLGPHKGKAIMLLR